MSSATQSESREFRLQVVYSQAALQNGQLEVVRELVTGCPMKFCGGKRRKDRQRDTRYSCWPKQKYPQNLFPTRQTGLNEFVNKKPSIIKTGLVFFFFPALAIFSLSVPFPALVHTDVNEDQNHIVVGDQLLKRLIESRGCIFAIKQNGWRV